MSVDWFFRVQEKQNGNERQRLQHESSPYAAHTGMEMFSAFWLFHGMPLVQEGY